MTLALALALLSLFLCGVGIGIVCCLLIWHCSSNQSKHSGDSNGDDSGEVRT